MVVVLLQPLVFLLQPPKVAPVVPHAPASCGRLCCRRGLTAPYYSHRWPGPAATAASHRSRTSEPSYSSPHARVSSAASSPAPRRALPRARRRPPPWCSRRGVVNVVKERLPSDVDCTWRGWQLGPWPQQGSASLLRAK